MKNYMKIGGHRFDITKCSLMAHVGPDKFFWTIKVFGKGELADEVVEPYAYSDNLLSFFNRRLQSWKEVLNEPISWESGYNQIFERREAALSIYSHEDIEESTLNFKQSGSNKFDLRWIGLTDVSAEEFDDFDDIRLDIAAEGSFDGVQVYGIPEQEALAKLKWYLNEDVFKFNSTLPDQSLLYTVDD